MENVWGDARLRSPLFFKTAMITITTVILVIKYILATSLFVGIVCAPAWLARQTDKGKQDMYLVRLGSWLFGWSIIGWFYALFTSVQK